MMVPEGKETMDASDSPQRISNIDFERFRLRNFVNQLVEAGEVEVGEVDETGVEAPEGDQAENEVDDVSDEGPAEVVDMDDEDDTASAQAEAEEKGE